MAADVFYTVSSTRQTGKKNVCTCLKSQSCCVVVPGQQAEILKSLVAPAQLLLTAVSHGAGGAQISLLALFLCIVLLICVWGARV